MIPEWGLLSLILALCLALMLSVIPLVGSYTDRSHWMQQATALVYGQFVFILLAFIALMWAFLTDDFSVDYVARHSNSLLPGYYKFSATWGGHEGSLLLWALTLSGWMTAVALTSRQLPLVLTARMLAVMGMVSAGLLLFLLCTSNPFTRILPLPPVDGVDLNPLLQDVGLIVHPPLLYMGYVGSTVAFAFAIAALLSDGLDSAWARWLRPWATVAWCFLTLGIALGSWWAYYELGWGGWWFWDPVENASFMPWLLGTALIHSLAVTEKRGLFSGWTLLLAIFTFALSLLGTFLVRSGILNSVHAFANDPDRGVFILLYLLIVVGCSLTLFAFKAPQTQTKQAFAWLSRETLLLVNNLLLTLSATTVLLGTLFPLLLEALDGDLISVGPPYFNTLLVPMGLLLAFAVGVGVLLHWKQGAWHWLWRQTRWLLLASLTIGALVSWLQGHGLIVTELAAIALASWIVLALCQDIRNKTRHTGLWPGLKTFKPAYYGMHLAHLGLAVSIVGMAISAGHSVQKDLRMAPGDRVTVGSYQFRFDGVERRSGPNYLSEYGTVTVYQQGRQITIMHPEKRLFQVQRVAMTEAAIDPGFTRDLYLALGDALDDQGSWALSIHVKPLVRWIWLGALLMALGGALAVIDRRYAFNKKQAVNQEAVA